MKLYTELQMRQSYEGLLQNVGTSIKQSDLPKVDDYINSITPIQLPTDDEIYTERWDRTYLPYDLSAFVEGAKWACEHIQNQIKNKDNANI